MDVDDTELEGNPKTTDEDKKDVCDLMRSERDFFTTDPIARWLFGFEKEDFKIPDEEPVEEISEQEYRNKYYPPPEIEKIKLKYDNAQEILWGRIEPVSTNLGQRPDILPLMFSTILPCPFSLSRVISISVRNATSKWYNSRFRVIMTSARYGRKYVCDIGFRFITLKMQKEQENELDDLEVPTATYYEHNFSIMLGPDKFHYIADNQIDSCPFAIDPAPVIFPADYVEVRGTLEFVSQFHIRTNFPYVWPPQQDRHSMDIAETYFHYTIGVRVKPGHCFIITFRPYAVQGGVGIQLKAGPYRQTPLSIFGYFDSDKAVEIQSTNDKFEFVPARKGRNFPFIFDKDNRVAILVCDDEFKVAINGKFYVAYGYTHSNLPGDLTDIKINTDKGTKIACSSVHNSFIEDYEMGEKELERFSLLETEFKKSFYRTYYDDSIV